MRYAYFPGCSANSTGISYTKSYDYVALAANVELAEIPDWNCCGASAAHAESELLGDALPARSLALAEEAFGDAPVLAPCAGCYQHLKTATAHAQESEEARARIEGVIGRPWSASAYVSNGLEPFMPKEAQERISARVCRPLDGLKVACYYGCALLRPTEVCSFDDDEQPHIMEDIVALSKAEPIEWNFKNMREAEVNAARAKEGLPALDIPVYYFTELLAASMGAPEAKSGIGRHFHPAADLHERALEAWRAQQAEQKAAEEAERAAKEAQRQARAAARAAKAKPKANAEPKGSLDPNAKPASGDNAAKEVIA